jgi:hypothetical protein
MGGACPVSALELRDDPGRTDGSGEPIEERHPVVMVPMVASQDRSFEVNGFYRFLRYGVSYRARHQVGLPGRLGNGHVPLVPAHGNSSPGTARVCSSSTGGNTVGVIVINCAGQYGGLSGLS